MKKIILTITALGLVATSLLAQSEIDALKYSKNDINGTARYMSMGGAFGALGGDISTLTNNPAGIGVYRSSEFAATLNLSNIGSKSTWNGTSVDANNWKGSFNNVAYIGTFKTASEGLVNFNFGIGFNRLKDFHRNYLTSNPGLMAKFENGTSRPTSLTEYIAIKSYGVDASLFPKDPNDLTPYNNYSWLSVLGYKGYLIDPDNVNKGSYYPLGHDFVANKEISPSAVLKVSERGYLDEYNFSFGGNVYDVFYFGATLGITDLNYRSTTTYDEDFVSKAGVAMNGYTLSNFLETRGSGVNLKAGIILRPLDFLRLGLSVQTPTFYKMTDYFDANVENNYKDGTANHDGTLIRSYVPENAFAEYSLQTPFKLQASTALVLGKKGILSFEYEYVDYSNMTMKDVDGYALGANNYIKKDMTAGNNIKVGGEFRVTPQFSLRGGYAFQSSPYKASVINQSPTTTPNVFGSTLPNYALDNGTNYYSGGFGYRFGSYYTDFAVVSRQAKEDVYAFSPISNGNEWVVPEKATLKTNTTQILFTFGYKY